MSSLVGGLQRLVRPAEMRDTFVAFATLFGFMTGHSLLETARDALFLTHVEIEQLPWVYIGIAGAMYDAEDARRTFIVFAPNQLVVC